MPPAKKADTGNGSILSFFKSGLFKNAAPGDETVPIVPSSQPTSSTSSHAASQSRNSPAAPRPVKRESQTMRDEQLGVARKRSLTPLPSSSPPRTAIDLSPLPIRSSSPIITSTNKTVPRHDVPSPLKEFKRPEAPPPRPSQPAPPAASFSSTSTLSSFPHSSATSTPPISSTSSSRRITAGGLKGVTNSSSEEESSGEDLPDISTFFKPRPRPAAAAAPICTPAPRLGSRLLEQCKKRPSLQTLPTSPPKKKYKNSLVDIVRDHEQAQLSEAMIASMESAVEEARRKEEEETSQIHSLTLDGDALIAAAGSDGEHRERLTMALERTEALQDEERFYFFLEDNPIPMDFDFPFDSLRDEPWGALYEDEDSRKEACISGVATELATRFPLPVVVTGWMATQLLYESDEVLCEAYIEILRASSIHQTSISDSWAAPSSVYKTRSLFENNYTEQFGQALPPGLTYLVQVAQFCAPTADGLVPDSSPAWTCNAILDLALMNVDEHVKKDTHLSRIIAKSIENILDALPEATFKALVPGVVATLFSPSRISLQIRCRAIHSLPGSTIRANELRRRLALETFSTATERKNADSQDWARSIAHFLKVMPQFQVKSSTNYSLLMDLIIVMDIAISSGWTDWSHLQPPKPTGPWAQPLPPSSVEKLHNVQIDAICKSLGSIMSRIKDPGTQYVHRMEAKDQIELLIKRLSHTVRSRPRLKKGVFSAGKGQSTLRKVTFDTSTFVKPQDPPANTLPSSPPQDPPVNTLSLSLPRSPQPLPSPPTAPSQSRRGRPYRNALRPRSR